jgi:hypothetical protein
MMMTVMMMTMMMTLLIQTLTLWPLMLMIKKSMLISQSMNNALLIHCSYAQEME